MCKKYFYVLMLGVKLDDETDNFLNFNKVREFTRSP